MNDNEIYKKRYYFLIGFLIILSFIILIKDDYNQRTALENKTNNINLMKLYAENAKKSMLESDELLRNKIIPYYPPSPIYDKPSDADNVKFNNDFSIYLTNQIITLDTQ
jgi:hypothetical protein